MKKSEILNRKTANVSEEKKSKSNTVSFKFLGSMCSQKNFCFWNCQVQFHVSLHIEVCSSSLLKTNQPLCRNREASSKMYFLHYDKSYKI